VVVVDQLIDGRGGPCGVRVDDLQADVGFERPLDPRRSGPPVRPRAPAFRRSLRPRER